MGERAICDLAVPLELIQEVLGLPTKPVGASYSPQHNTLYLRIPSLDKYTKCYSSKVVEVEETGATIEMMRFTLDPPEPTFRGERVPTTEYIPTSMGTLHITTDNTPQHCPAEEFQWIPTDPDKFNGLVGAPEGTFDEVVVSGIMVYAHDVKNNVWLTYPARYLSCP